jgi:hypothetical protein
VTGLKHALGLYSTDCLAFFCNSSQTIGFGRSLTLVFPVLVQATFRAVDHSVLFVLSVCCSERFRLERALSVASEYHDVLCAVHSKLFIADRIGVEFV